ncbi:DUF998 domain-containing protein [Lacisediminihabitans changchengi]|uniref:DUF998 domain-containing protein n=1 Tax=Lacisediminihabitans changchengi TaxID=2787634 RepID=A0A934W5W5_9MICO|nr:DUF998 domain-containing protein [Lacisediminihabitans changchengi]MBK4348990.1 DUF998 domain-containing protein [Lacisediminihabitans changchengi]
MSSEGKARGFDSAAAVTRSMLGWGVVAGPFYVIFGLILAANRPGFDLTRDALSLLLLGSGGWAQAVNLILAGLMTIVAAIGLARTPRWSRPAAALVGIYGLSLIVSAVFPPDATADFPPDVGRGVLTVSGLLHLAFGGFGFLSLGVAAILAAGWHRRRSSRGAWSIIAGIVVIISFGAGGALSQGPAGVALLWIAVLAGWVWLAVTSVMTYRAVPHPVIAQRREEVA